MKIQILLILTGLINFQFAWGQGVHAGYSAPIQSEVNFDEFVKEIVKHNVESVDGALPLLPASLLENFTLVHTSHSLQSSSPLYPRAILYGNTGSSIFTFNGSPKDNGHYSIESVSVEDDILKFREIVFKKENTKNINLALQPSEIAFENENIIVSKPNPNKCMGCHGRSYEAQPLASPRYLWNQYPRWPGVYGEFDDILMDEGKVLQVGGTEISERAAFLLFKKMVEGGSDEHKRYSHLDLFKNDDQPYSDNPAQRQLKSLPNGRFGMLLTTNYSYNMARQFIKSYNSQNQITKKEVISSICDLNFADTKSEYLKVYNASIIKDLLDAIGLTLQFSPMTRDRRLAKNKFWKPGITPILVKNDDYLNSHFEAHILNYFFRKLGSNNQQGDLENPYLKDEFYKSIGPQAIEHLKNFSLTIYSLPLTMDDFDPEITQAECFWSPILESSEAALSYIR